MELKINYENGDYLYTRINASHEEAISYFVGKTFNRGTITDKFVKCLSVEKIIH